jgi:NAD(P)-dependent dehydrogenase (short-subunit alcohol dehydrogenase family)
MKNPKTILITGCSSGIGKYCAIELLGQGWQVYATARKAEDLNMLEEHGLEAFHLDYNDTQSIHTCFEAVMAKTDGKLDALFNNGAYGQPGAVEDLKTDVLREQFEANFFGWHELTNLVVPVMRKQGHGRIVHCSSVLGWVTAPWRGAYNSSKFALEGLASTMRIELTGTNIHVSLIEPGPISTKFTENALSAFLKNVDYENSAHKVQYEQELKRLNSSGGANRFRLEPVAVYKKLDHALNARKPNAHYGVTVPTHFMDIVRRILPTRMVDKMLLKNNS